jgi:hypothetical protein
MCKLKGRYKCNQVTWFLSPYKTDNQDIKTRGPKEEISQLISINTLVYNYLMYFFNAIYCSIVDLCIFVSSYLI